MYVILKQLLPVLESVPEEMQYINFIVSISGDKIYEYETLEEANLKMIELYDDARYEGRKLKIKECL